MHVKNNRIPRVTLKAAAQENHYLLYSVSSRSCTQGEGYSLPARVENAFPVWSSGLVTQRDQEGSYVFQPSETDSKAISPHTAVPHRDCVLLLKEF